MTLADAIKRCRLCEFLKAGGKCGFSRAAVVAKGVLVRCMGADPYAQPAITEVEVCPKGQKEEGS